MRVLLLMRGTPSSGKSTWIEQNGLSDYSLSADKLRLLYRSKVFDKNGKENIDQSVNGVAWKTLFEILEKRMSYGEFTVIDACNSKTKEMNAYKALAEKYRYRIYCVDFTDIPIEQVKAWNSNRIEFKRVSEDCIDLYYSRFQTQQIPSGIKMVTRDNALSEIMYNKICLDEYKNIYVIGDVHGCYTALNELLPNGIEDENYYIFLGDYLDRGIENDKVLEFMISIKDKPNVCLLEGNHEIHLWNYANDNQSNSPEFNFNTLRQISNIDKKDIRQFYRKLRQCAYFKYKGKAYFGSHAGVSSLRKVLTFYATNDFIKGVGSYEDIYDCAKTFEKENPEIIQFCGHRNPESRDFKIGNNTYSLEGYVEKGGCLRAVKINENGIETIAIKNGVFKTVETPKEDEKILIPELSMKEIVDKLRENKKAIVEKTFDDYNISSFNFSKDVFYDKVWNDVTTKARGLFINTKSNTVAARSYEKFFNINEVRETELSTLSNTLKFPVTAYVKYNGFLGILGYDEEHDKLLFCSKSRVDGEFSKYFEDIFMEKYGKEYDNILKFVKEKNVSFVFEVIDIENDPHIIEYKENHLVLLDIVYRDINFKKIGYDNLKLLAVKFGMEYKERAYVIKDWAEFLVWYNEITDADYKFFNGLDIEGFVIEDRDGFMTKVKGYYYNFWKFMRKVKDEVLRQTKTGMKGYIEHTSALTNAEMNLFYGFLRDLAKSGYNGKTDIITLRKLFKEIK